MYKLRISFKAKNEIKKISKTHKCAIVLALKDIKENPFSGKPLTRNLAGKYSYRVGIYRIIYIIRQRDKIVEILTAGHRSNVY